jgi:hypothetical protein
MTRNLRMTGAVAAADRSAASDARYGWAAKCLEQFGSAPRQILNERNTVAHVTEYEGPAAPAPADL